MVHGPVGKLGRAARLPRSRRDAAGIALLLVLLESALALFLFVSIKWMVGLEQPAHGIVLFFTIATTLTFILFGVSLLADTLPVLFGKVRREELAPRDE